MQNFKYNKLQCCTVSINYFGPLQQKWRFLCTLDTV